jgi:hypothetical protein
MKHLVPLLFLCITVLFSCATKDGSGSGREIEFNINKELVENGVLKITLPDKRPSSLAIQSPQGEWFIIQDISESIQFMPQSRFNSINVMHFQLDETMGIVWRGGISSKEHVFKDDGAYLIYFADNLETEPENTFSFQESIVYRKRY